MDNSFEDSFEELSDEYLLEEDLTAEILKSACSARMILGSEWL